ncbi:MAG: hypothetical protein M3347_02550, partial [Armatimonadota bacterium]|nr:hypothetical protein [Armatimonadota bacterium]
CNGALQVSDDGTKFRDVRTFNFSREAKVETLSFPEVEARFFRLHFTAAGTKSKQLAIAEVELSPRLVIDNLEGKAAFVRGDNIQPETNVSASPELVVARDKIVDLSARLQPDGKLEWDVPDGEWTILRLGHTPTGKTNHPAPPEGTGPECDKLSREAMDAHFAGMMGKILADLGPLAGKSLNNVLIDSYEVGSQNWTARFRDEFRQRRGYDLQLFLPAFTGRVVDSPELTDRFLWDLRRTISDMMAENYFGRMAELAHQHGLLYSVEPYGNATFDDFAAGASGDIPMGEFWTPSGVGNAKLPASIAHVYGRKYVGAESFTASPENGRWQNDPARLKAQGDAVYCAGINRIIYHRYAHQPWLNRLPGMTMGQWGTHFERTNTWWNEAGPWLRYQARCQYLLQSGLFVADALYLNGEGAPNSLRAGNPALPKGYDYDGCNSEVVLNRLTVRDGRLVLPNGMSYRVLILPPGDTMTPALARKIRELATDGATIIGPRPVRSPSLQNYPQCDAEVKALAAEVWGDLDGKTVTERAVGKGRIIWGKPLDAVLAALGVPPDFELVGATPAARLVYIHRVIGDADCYFVSNQRNVAAEVPCTFRVSGRIPELWHPDSGVIEPAPVYTERDGRTTVPLRFDPSGSVFVLFRRPAANAPHLVAVSHTGPANGGPRNQLEIRRAVYEAVDGAGELDVTARLRERVKDGSIAVEVSNENMGRDPTPMHVKQLRVDYVLDGKPGTKIVAEHDVLELPEGGAPATQSAFDLAAAPNGWRLTAWRPGTFELKTAANRALRAEVRDLPQPVEIGGSWELRFPPNWGAPPRVALDKLISWPEHADPGVRYFSGTATYVKALDIPAALLARGQVLTLDLGQVKNLAGVVLNGRYLGLLWKPPFRLDITDAARPGRNILEVRVTNLWPNRLIGDEQLPDDVEWEGVHLKAWPQWLLEGKPRPSGRLTFTTWKHYAKDSPLLPSGLLGPVTLRPGKMMVVR